MSPEQRSEVLNPERGEVFSQIAHERKSVRGFKPDRLSEQVLRRLFEDAQRSPSNCNTQPWKVAVASGEVADKLRTTMTDGMLSGNIDMDFPYDGQYEGVYKERQKDSAAQLLEVAQGIQRDDKAGRNTAFMRNYQAFDAPHIAFFFLPAPFGIREAADLGMYAQTFMLALTAYGYAGCPQTALSFHASAVKAELGVAKENKLLFAVSFGIEDPAHPANACSIGREKLEHVVSFVG